MGITPLSTPISTRGKSGEGKTDTGMVKARYAPSRARVRIRKMTGRECRAIQCSPPDELSTVDPTKECLALGQFTHSLRSDYFSPDPSLGALEAGFDSSGDGSVEGRAASIVILVLSGNP